MPSADVVLQGLTKRYPTGTIALRDLDLTVAAGEMLVVVGPSGSGKTTLLRLVAGLESPSAGHVLIGGRDVTASPPRERDVSFVFQRPALYPHLNVRDNLAFARRLRIRRFLWSPTRNERLDLAERVASAAQMLGLQDVLDRLPGELSGGQQQRVALGRAVVRRPAVFLLDEPLSSLDPPLRTGLRRELHLLQRSLSATMVYVTHDQTEALTLGDRVAVLDGGLLRQAATPAELLDRPANRFVASFIGWPSMNLFDGRLEGDEWVAPFGRLRLSPGQARKWAAFAGRELTAGVRPDRLRLTDDESGWRCEVAWTEAAAGSTVVAVEREGTTLTACVPGRPGWKARQNVTVVIDMHQAHLFDRGTGDALCHPETG